MPSYAKISVIAFAVAALAGCGGSYGSSPATTGSVAGAHTSKGFGAATVSGVGKVLVDGKGRTVYILTSSSTKNVPCTAASGCTAVWPPAGTYMGWRVYEYSGDSGSGQANGEGIASFGGTWYVLSPSGQPVKTSSSNRYGGGGY